MKHFPRYRPLVRGLHRSPVNSLHKGQWRGALMFSLIYAWINIWVNNRVAGDLRRHRAHYDVSVMGKVFTRKTCFVSITLWYVAGKMVIRLLVSNVCSFTYNNFGTDDSTTSLWTPWHRIYSTMMTLWQGHTFRISFPLWGESTDHRSLVTRAFDVCFDVSLTKMQNKLSRGRWTEISSRSFDVPKHAAIVPISFRLSKLWRSFYSCILA